MDNKQEATQANIFIKTVVDCLMAHQYPQLITVLRVLANELPPEKKKKYLAEINKVQKHTSIEFNKLCFYYIRSFSRDLKRGVVFRQGRVSYVQIRTIMQSEVIAPVTEIAIGILTSKGNKLEDILTQFSASGLHYGQTRKTAARNSGIEALPA